MRAETVDADNGEDHRCDAHAKLFALEESLAESGPQEDPQLIDGLVGRSAQTVLARLEKGHRGMTVRF
jgi:hypothetical protein